MEVLLRLPRVLYFIPPSAGGMQRHILNLIRGCDRTYVKPFAVGWINEILWEELQMLDVPSYRFNFSPGGQSCSLLLTLRLFRELNVVHKKMDNWNIDLIHCHGTIASIYARLLGRLSGRPVIYTVHGLPRGAKGVFRKYGTQICVRFLERWLQSTTAAYIPVSKALRREVAEWGIDDRRIHLIYNGIDSESDIREEDIRSFRKCWLTSRANHEVWSGPVIGTVARLSYEKGVDQFIRVAARIRSHLPKTCFVVVGDGPERERLHKLAIELRLSDHIVFTGYMRDPRPALANMHVYVQTSRQEGFGLAALEAQAAGLPVVAWDTGGLNEVVCPQRTGMLINFGAVDALADAVADLLSDEARLQAWSQQACSWAQQFSLTKFCQSTLEVYEQVMNEGDAPIQSLDELSSQHVK